MYSAIKSSKSFIANYKSKCERQWRKSSCSSPPPLIVNPIKESLNFCVPSCVNDVLTGSRCLLFQIDGAKPGVPGGGEGVLANFFNSLLHKKTGPGTPTTPKSPGMFSFVAYDRRLTKNTTSFKGQNAIATSLYSLLQWQMSFVFQIVESLNEFELARVYFLVFTN